jgi:cation diffusion facilitator CzcD-associated flavoprotein CzcO
LLAAHPGTLLGLDFRKVASQWLRPVELFNLLHRPSDRALPPERMGMQFRRGTPIDCLLLSREPVGGLWNNVPRNLLTLSPAHWMELAFYPMVRWAAEQGRALDPEALIVKRDLVDYYHSIPERFGFSHAVRSDITVTRVQPDPTGFRLTTQTAAGREQSYRCRYLVYAVGQRCYLRKLGIPGEELPLVTQVYDRPETFPGDVVMVVGGGRSADWAATELHDAGRTVHYVMRQPEHNHWRLINDSRYGLPYYARIAEIMEGGSPRLQTHYQAYLRGVDSDGTVLLEQGDRRLTVRVDRVLLEIGGEADYSLFDGFPPLTLVEKRDRYRFQCMQMVTHPHNYESVDIPRLYPGGYLAQGINNVVVAMHGTTYAIAADILQREGMVPVAG